MRNTNKIFYTTAAIAAFLSAGTTFLLWFLPRLYTAPGNFEERVALVNNQYYMLKQWVNFFHIPLALTAYLALAYKLRIRELPKVISGMMWFIAWGLIEMAGMAMIIFSVNKDWRANYAAADSAKRMELESNITAFYSVWDSMFFVLLIAFLLGTIFFAWATWKEKGIGKLLSWLFLLAAPLTILITLSGYANLTWGDTIAAWIYPVLQPVSRFILGMYLLKGENKIQS
jgi:hypothetical protein